MFEAVLIGCLAVALAFSGKTILALWAVVWVLLLAFRVPAEPKPQSHKVIVDGIEYIPGATAQPKNN
jgi:hypothetical protein